MHEGDIIPGKVLSSQRNMYVSYDGAEIAKQRYENLCGGMLSWIKMHGCHPMLCKVHPLHDCLFIPFAGIEARQNSYELLIEN